MALIVGPIPVVEVLEDGPVTISLFWDVVDDVEGLCFPVVFVETESVDPGAEGCPDDS